MKKLTLVTLISSALSAGAIAGDHKEKIESSFADLDNDDNGYISREEADDDDIYEHFATIDMNGDMMLSKKEFKTHVTNNPQHFEDDVVASVQTLAADVEEVDPKTVSAAGEDDVAAEQTANVEVTTEREIDTDDGEVTMETEKTVVAKGDFEMMDIDNNGEITLDEAEKSGVELHFDDIDLNDDELVTRVEYTQYQRGAVNDYEE